MWWMAKRKPAKLGPAPQHFFEKQLAGDPPLSLETAQELCREAIHLIELHPWDRLSERHLLFFGTARSEPSVCSIMGANGEVFALAVYPGLEGYYSFQRVYDDPDYGLDDFLFEQRSIKIELVARSELTRQDRELLKAVRYPASLQVAPQFRAMRPAYYPWYISEPEGVILAAGAAAFNGVSSRPDAENLWDREDRYPLATHCADGSGYDLSFIKLPPEPARMPPSTPALDAERIAKISGKPRGPITVDMDTFHGVPIGGPNDRPSAARMGLAVDSTSAMILHLHVYEASLTAGEVLLETMLAAIEKCGKIPAAIRVQKAQHKTVLLAAAQALGCEIQLEHSLPALEHAKTALMETVFGR
jgi:hypothetical protein